MLIKTMQLAATSALALSLSAGAAFAQPTLNPQGGSGNYEMDHSRMGGPQQGQPPSGPAPTLNPQGGSGGNPSMDHSRMGGANVGGGTPSFNPTGSGSVEMTHPGNPGTGHGHEQGRQQRR